MVRKKVGAGWASMKGRWADMNGSSGLAKEKTLSGFGLLLSRAHRERRKRRAGPLLVRLGCAHGEIREAGQAG
jgi:hypothetical protein